LKDYACASISKVKDIEKNTEIRVATAAEVDLLVSWAKLEGWNPGLDDADMFYAADETGFLVALLDGIPVAGISLVKLNANHSFLGLYICKPEYRGKGFGIQIWNKAIESAGARSIGLDGVVEQQDNYSKQQFIYSHRNIRFAGNALLNNFELKGELPDILKANDSHLSTLAKYDSAIGGFERGSFYHAWFKANSSRYTYIAIENTAIVGVIGVRQCIEGFKVGPWLANDHHIAEALLFEASKKIGNEIMVVDVPEPNQAAMEIVKRLGLSPTFETARMYRGQKPEINTEKLFGVATLELG